MTPRTIKPSLMLAQFAQALPNGTVNIMGGGLTVLPTTPTLVFIAGTIEFSWEQAMGRRQHQLRFELLDDQGLPVVNDQGEPVLVAGDLALAPAPGVRRGTPLPVPMAQPITPNGLAPDSRYEWRYEIDGETHEDWNLGFSTMPEAQSKAA